MCRFKTDLSPLLLDTSQDIDFVLLKFIEDHLADRSEHSNEAGCH